MDIDLEAIKARRESRMEDAEYAAWCRNHDIPALVAEVERLSHGLWFSNSVLVKVTERGVAVEDLFVDQHAEIERLRAEVERLRAAIDALEPVGQNMDDSDFGRGYQYGVKWAKHQLQEATHGPRAD